MILFAFKHKMDGTLAELLFLNSTYLVEYGCDSPTFVGISREEMQAIIDDQHDYIINDIDMSDYEIVEFELKTR